MLRSLLDSPIAIFAALSMAHDEMKVIRALDQELLAAHKEKIWLYFARNDSWVGESRNDIVRVIGKESLRVVDGERDIPHAFCISECSLLEFTTRHAELHILHRPW